MAKHGIQQKKASEGPDVLSETSKLACVLRTTLGTGSQLNHPGHIVTRRQKQFDYCVAP